MPRTTCNSSVLIAGKPSVSNTVFSSSENKKKLLKYYTRYVVEALHTYKEQPFLGHLHSIEAFPS